MLNWQNKNITSNQNAFDLDGMINPCFQNNGESPVLINGNLLEKGDSFPINTNGMPLQGTATINFVDETKSAKLICNYLVSVNKEFSCNHN